MSRERKPAAPAGEEVPPLWPLPFPLPQASARLVVAPAANGRELVYRCGNIALYTAGGALVGISICGVRLIPSNMLDFWEALAAVVRAGAALPPERVPPGFIIPAPAAPVSTEPLRDEDAPNLQQRKAVIGTRYRCGPAVLAVRYSPARRAALDAFGHSGLDPAALLRELPAALALLLHEF